jgi:hypothetical protein
MENKENLSDQERRSGTDRRKQQDPDYKGPERRSGFDRRLGERQEKAQRNLNVDRR